MPPRSWDQRTWGPWSSRPSRMATQPAITTPGRTRLRRLRRTRELRNLVAETRVTARAADHAALRAARRSARISRSRRCRESRSKASRTVVETIAQDFELGIRAVLLFGHPEHGGKTPDGRAAAAANGAVQRACERLKQRIRRPTRRHHGRVPVRVHRPRPLRHARRAGPDLERRVAEAARRDGRCARARGRRRRRAVRHDGRPRRGDSRRARPIGLRGHGTAVVRREVRLRVLRAVSRGGRLARRERRPAQLPDGLRATRARPCARRCSTSRKARIGSW